MPILSSPVLKPDVEATPDTRLAPLYRVLIHNDDVTPMDFVVLILNEIFHLSRALAIDVMFEAHTKGVAHVVTEPLERAEFHVDQARSLSRARKYPLTFSVERED
jgi:ATP-dependent Clp protease adaptor protein ClpS